LDIYQRVSISIRDGGAARARARLEPTLSSLTGSAQLEHVKFGAFGSAQLSHFYILSLKLCQEKYLLVAQLKAIKKIIKIKTCIE
jgi:hypothetical protein